MSKIIYIDTETTGLNPRTNGVIQIAGMVEITGKEVKRFDYKIRPFEKDRIEEKAMETNGISEAKIRTYPEPKEVHREFTQMMGEYIDKFDKADKFTVVGYNVRFDMDMLREWFKKCGDLYYGSWFFFPPIDVMCMVAVDRLYKPRPFNYKLETIISEYGIKTEGDLHDAMTDIRVTKELFQRLIK